MWHAARRLEGGPPAQLNTGHSKGVGLHRVCLKLRLDAMPCSMPAGMHSYLLSPPLLLGCGLL